jgi:phosphatidylethanolamine-binding protein (PEBP) family uncharacterized protein
VIDDFLPSLLLKVSWPSNNTADLGNTIKPDELQDTPTVELNDDPSSSTTSKKSSSMKYTITLTDPDAPSRDNPEWSEMCHWIATGVSVSSSSTLQDSLEQVYASKKLKEIMKYKAPGPPPKTGKHRYVFLAFVPANGTTKKLSLTKPDDRQHWGTGKERHGVRDWAEENGLVAVGECWILMLRLLERLLANGDCRSEFHLR